jgi:hypothetical protein
MTTLYDPEDTKVLNYVHLDATYVLTCDPVYGMWTVANKKGGKIHDELSGRYTQVEMAKDAIQAFHRNLALLKDKKVA